MTNRGCFWLYRLLTVATCLVAAACSEPPRRQVAQEAPPPPAESNPTPSIVTDRDVPELLPPNQMEVTGAIERVFKGAANVDERRETFVVVGDFNGDRSQDIAVTIKPTSGRLDEINDELAAWILVAPVQAVQQASKKLPYPEVHAEMIARKRVRIAEGDVLLAVVHGFGSTGWRDPQATQTYVLKDAIGDSPRVQPHKEILRQAKDPFPRLRGDVIAQTIRGQAGFLYYNGAKYAWYDANTYQSEQPARIVHGGSRVSQ